MLSKMIFIVKILKKVFKNNLCFAMIKSWLRFLHFLEYLYLTKREFNHVSTIIDKIKELKTKRNAIILAHNYQRGEVQDIADFTGDSLGLSQQAAKAKADIIVFCGVHFMAETASILCPDKLVLLPDAHAGCPMANMITAAQLVRKKKELPGATVVT